MCFEHCIKVYQTLFPKTVFYATFNSEGSILTNHGASYTKLQWDEGEMDQFSYLYLIAGFDQRALIDVQTIYFNKILQYQRRLDHLNWIHNHEKDVQRDTRLMELYREKRAQRKHVGIEESESDVSTQEDSVPVESSPAAPLMDTTNVPTDATPILGVLDDTEVEEFATEEDLSSSSSPILSNSPAIEQPLCLSSCSLGSSTIEMASPSEETIQEIELPSTPPEYKRRFWQLHRTEVAGQFLPNYGTYMYSMHFGEIEEEEEEVPCEPNLDELEPDYDFYYDYWPTEFPCFMQAVAEKKYPTYLPGDFHNFRGIFYPTEPETFFPGDFAGFKALSHPKEHEEFFPSDFFDLWPEVSSQQTSRLPRARRTKPFWGFTYTNTKKRNPYGFDLVFHQHPVPSPC